jgi:hypothetical protein
MMVTFRASLHLRRRAAQDARLRQLLVLVAGLAGVVPFLRPDAGEVIGVVEGDLVVPPLAPEERGGGGCHVARRLVRRLRDVGVALLALVHGRQPGLAELRRLGNVGVALHAVEPGVLLVRKEARPGGLVRLLRDGAGGLARGQGAACSDRDEAQTERGHHFTSRRT